MRYFGFVPRDRQLQSVIVNWVKEHKQYSGEKIPFSFELQIILLLNLNSILWLQSA